MNFCAAGKSRLSGAGLSSHGHCKAAHWEVARSCFLLLRLCVLLLCLQPPTNCTRLLWSQIKRLVFLSLILLACFCLLLLVVHRQYPCNVLAHNLDLCELGGGTACLLCHSELGKLCFHL